MDVVVEKNWACSSFSWCRLVTQWVRACGHPSREKGQKSSGEVPESRTAGLGTAHRSDTTPESHREHKKNQTDRKRWRKTISVHSMVSFQWQGFCLFFRWRPCHRGFRLHCRCRWSCGRSSCHCHSHLLCSVPIRVRLLPALLHSAKTPLLAPVNLKALISHIPARAERSHSIGDPFWGMWGKT